MRPHRKAPLPAFLLAAAIAALPSLRADGPVAPEAPAAPQVSPEPAEKGRPHVEVEKFTVDLGKITRGKNAEAVFVLKNTGDATLKILSAKPT